VDVPQLVWSGDGFIPQSQVQCKVTSFESCCGAIDNEAGFYLSSSLSPPFLCTHLAQVSEVCNSTDQAVHGWMHSKQV